MRIRMLFNASGLIDGHSNPALGTEIDVSDVIGESLVRKGLAEAVAVFGEERAKAETRPAPKRTRTEKRG